MYEWWRVSYLKDDVERIIDSMVRAEAVIIGSPVYYGSVTPELRMFCDRIGFMFGGKLEGKIGVPVTVCTEMGPHKRYDADNCLVFKLGHDCPWARWWVVLSNGQGYR